jgi:diguanylate cyclase (GGDEF)-like protein
MERAEQPEAVDPGGRSWLCRDDFDRQRMLEMEERVRPVRRRAALIMTLAILASAPWLGWWPLVFVVCIMSCFGLADLLMPRLARPEYLMFGAWVCSGLSIAGAVILSGDRGAVTLSYLAIPVMTLSTRFSTRGIVVGVLVSIQLAVAVAFVFDTHAALSNPPLAIEPVALILCVAVLSTPLMQSEIKHRSAAVVDPLTGMLNRNALNVRVQELAVQANLTGEPVGLIVGDLDHFKRVNDTRGHTIGDAVLRDVADRLRGRLRAFDLAYRLGGEEFIVLLPGAELDETAWLAEQLRDAVSADPSDARVPVTMSLGVAASRRGEPFDYPVVFAQADRAMYEAKRSGRDRVCVTEDERVPVPA